MMPGVDLDAPRLRPLVQHRQADQQPGGVVLAVALDGQRDEQVVLGIADQVLHDAPGLRVRGVTEVGPEPVLVTKRTWSGNGTTTFATTHPSDTHPVSQHDLRDDTAEDLEALGEQRQRGGLLLILGEPHEPEARAAWPQRPGDGSCGPIPRSRRPGLPAANRFALIGPLVSFTLVATRSAISAKFRARWPRTGGSRRC
jgi:hypothetical protein